MHIFNFILWGSNIPLTEDGELFNLSTEAIALIPNA